MNSAILLVIGIALYGVVGYRLYSGWLARKVFGLSDDEVTPAHDPALQDGVDYVPADGHVLWGHHFTSIAGAAPIIGPAIAVIWGWVPAILWVVFGTIFIGAVHDFGALVISARHDGKTMGDLAGDLIHPRVRLLFQAIVYFLIWVVLAVFAKAIATLFMNFPASVIPVNFEIMVAPIIGWLFYRKDFKILGPSLVALALLYVMIGVGVGVDQAGYTVGFPEQVELLGATLAEESIWVVLLLVYSFVASILPVWVLLQPRDFINSHQLIVGLGGLVLGVLIWQPTVQAPAYNPSVAGAPPLFPLLFVTIACGAISGFHGLVSSGTTSKQLDRMPQARFIGYGGMLGEGTLALMATLAVSAGISDWASHYGSWASAADGGHAIGAFVTGGAAFLEVLWIPTAWAQAVVAVLVISFAATSLDTGTRIQRLVVQELGEVADLGFLRNRYVASLVAVVPAIALAFSGQMGALWHLFGTTNQLIGGMTLLVLFVYLLRSDRPKLSYALPMVFLILMTTGAMVVNLVSWTGKESIPLLTVVVGALILVLELWVIVETVLVCRRVWRGDPRG